MREHLEMLFCFWWELFSMSPASHRYHSSLCSGIASKAVSGYLRDGERIEQSFSIQRTTSNPDYGQMLWHQQNFSPSLSAGFCLDLANPSSYAIRGFCKCNLDKWEYPAGGRLNGRNPSPTPSCFLGEGHARNYEHLQTLCNLRVQHCPKSASKLHQQNRLT